MAHLFIIVVLSLINFEMIFGHGMMVDPPNRSSLWRYGFDVEEHYTDMGLNCGGAGRQWFDNNGKCGVCGDPYDETKRDHEAGGRYASGIIARSYQAGETIEVLVNLTAYHKGYFEFRLCPNNNVKESVTQNCLDKNLLKGVDGTDRYHITKGVGQYRIKLQLPKGLTCSQCVMQWKYNTGNSWGCDDEFCCIGCGPQEQFINCADVKIGFETGGWISPPITQRPAWTPRPTTKSPPTKTTKTPSWWATSSTKTTRKVWWTPRPTTAKPTAKPTTKKVWWTPRPTTKKVLWTPQPTTKKVWWQPRTTTSRPAIWWTTPSGSQEKCKAIGKWSSLDYADKWCADNCARCYCPTVSCATSCFQLGASCPKLQIKVNYEEYGPVLPSHY